MQKLFHSLAADAEEFRNIQFKAGLAHLAELGATHTNPAVSSDVVQYGLTGKNCR
jgi:hypothetical protein